MDFLGLFDGFFTSLSTMKSASNPSEDTEGHSENKLSQNVENTKAKTHDVIKARLKQMKEQRRTQTISRNQNQDRNRLKR